MQIEKLAKLFSKFKTYPLGKYGDKSPVRVFQKMYPDDHYSRDLEVFLHFQNYMPEQRGADLPWWGKKFFTQEKGFRTLVVAQDSKALDAGSVALYVNLMPLISSKDEYKEYADQIGSKRSFFNSWSIVKKQLEAWDVPYDFLYVTDAKKVYKKGSWDDQDFDEEKSRELLKAEIDLCKPDLVILLGASPLQLMEGGQNFATAVEGGRVIMSQGTRCVVAPFFIGMGRAGFDFKRRLEIATLLIKKELNF